jgi:hypothetical protein
LVASPAPSEAVNHPSHYNRGGVEAVDVIEAWGLGFNLGNALKYLSRAGHKEPAKTVEDLDKAAWYIQREKRRIALGRTDATDR